VGLAAGFGGQAGQRRPVHPRLGDLGQGQVGDLDPQVRGLRVAVEVQREVVGREDLAEGHRGGQPRVGADKIGGHAEFGELGADEPAEGVVAGLGDDRRAVAVTRGGDRDVGRAAAEELAEAGDLLQRDADLRRVDVHTDAPYAHDVVHITHWGTSFDSSGGGYLLGTPVSLIPGATVKLC